MSRVLSPAQKEVLERNRWKKGQPSPNPSGRSKGVAQKAREASRDGEICFEYLVDLVTGKVPGAKPSDRTDGARLCLSYAFGSPLNMSATLALEGSTAEGLGEQLSGEALTTLIRALNEIHPDTPAVTESNPELPPEPK